MTVQRPPDRELAERYGSLFRLPADATMADHSHGDPGPRRGPRRRRPVVFGPASTFSLTPQALRREIGRRKRDGWQPWEIAVRFADPAAATAPMPCPGEFAPGGWRPHCARGAA